MCAKTSFSDVELWVLVLDYFVVAPGRVLGGESFSSGKEAYVAVSSVG